MRPADGKDAFFAAPAGRFVSGDNWIYFCTDDGLFGQIYWGRLALHDVERLTEMWEVELGDHVPRHLSIVDARAVELIDADCYAHVAARLAERAEALGKKVERQALVCSDGPSGALIAGFYQVQRPAYEVGVHTSLQSALEWLGRPALLSEIEQLRAGSLKEEPLLRALKAHLAGTLGDADLPRAAVALAVSQRTLQRRLSNAGTNFLDELRGARVRAAECLLAETDRKLSSIAIEVGCASLANFSVMFRRAHGMTASEWRARHRK